MMHSGCYNCPVKVCETLTYRGSTCKAQRAKIGVNYDPLTHGDQVRSMTDEELAKALVEGTLFAEMHFCKDLSECIALLDDDEDIPDEKCVQCALEWLRQPVRKEA